MKKFKFRYQNISDLRDRQEKKALSEFAQAQKAYRAELEKKATLLENLNKAIQERENLSKLKSEINQYQIIQKFIDGQKVRILQQDQAIFRTGKILEKKYELFLNSRKNKKIMDKLHERELEKHKELEKKHEAKELDFIYTTKSKKMWVNQ